MERTATRWGSGRLQPGNHYDYEVLDDSEVTIDLQATSAVVRRPDPRLYLRA